MLANNFSENDQIVNCTVTYLFLNHLFTYFSNQVIGVVSREYIPKGTRFGPLVGESYTAENVPKDANRKYFWRVSCFVSESFNKVGVGKKKKINKKNTGSLPVPLTDFLCDIMG